MNQGELTAAIAKRFFLTQSESQEILKFILSKTTETLEKGERLSLRNFGSFTKEKRPAKRVRHPKTGKILIIPAHFTVNFHPSVILLKKL